MNNRELALEYVYPDILVLALSGFDFKTIANSTNDVLLCNY